MGALCERICQLKINENCCYAWNDVHADENIAVYLLARGMAARGADYQPFTKLRNVQVQMCWCTPPAVWHALLSLMRHAVHMHGVARLTTTDPLAVCALSYLPMCVLHPVCMWPQSFTDFLVDTPLSKSSRRRRYLASRCVTGTELTKCAPHTPSTLELMDELDAKELDSDKLPKPLRLHRNSDVFRQYRQHFNTDVGLQQILQRWESGSFPAADDEMLAAQQRPVECAMEATKHPGHTHCARSHRFSMRVEDDGDVEGAAPAAAESED